MVWAGDVTSKQAEGGSSYRSPSQAYSRRKMDLFAYQVLAGGRSSDAPDLMHIVVEHRDHQPAGVDRIFRPDMHGESRQQCTQVLGSCR